MSVSNERGLVRVPYLFTGNPSLSQRNLVKFHLIASPRNPVLSVRKNAHRGWDLSPLTSTLENMGNVIPYFVAMNCFISCSVPGSWPPNWLQGNPQISKPWSWYLSYNCCSSLYDVFVVPHLEATFTIKTTLPLYFERCVGLPLMSIASKSKIVFLWARAAVYVHITVAKPSVPTFLLFRRRKFIAQLRKKNNFWFWSNGH